MIEGGVSGGCKAARTSRTSDMPRDTTVIAFGQPEAIDDPLLQVRRDDHGGDHGAFY